jgi:hypothetical protein
MILLLKRLHPNFVLKTKKPISDKNPFLSLNTQVSTLLNIYMYVLKSMDNNNKWLILQMDLPHLYCKSQKGHTEPPPVF